MQALQEVTDQAHVLEALDYRRGSLPHRFLPCLPQADPFFLHNDAVYENMNPLTNFVPNTIAPAVGEPVMDEHRECSTFTVILPCVQESCPLTWLHFAYARHASTAQAGERRKDQQ
jgi:hypothetical protein